MVRVFVGFGLFLMAARAGEMPGKAAEYHAALVKRPESAVLFERFREAWLQERSVDEMDAELLARANAGEPGAWAILARARLIAGSSESALEAFEKARAQMPAAWLDLELAKLRMAARDFAAAEKCSLRVPEGDERRPEALKLAGLACLRSDRVDEAMAHWSKAVAAAPGDKGLLEDLTELTRREGRLDLALDFCGKWRDATDDAYAKTMAGLRRGDLLLASQRFDEALAELANVLKISADGSWLEREVLARAEQAYRERGNTTGWAKWIAGRAEENPTRLHFRRAEAQALASAGKPDEALEVLAEVMKRSPGDLSIRWQRVGLLERALKTEKAYEECKLLAAEEKSEAAGLKLAELAFRLEKRDAVKRSLDEVLAAADPAKHVLLAGLYARYGLPAESERAWKEAAKGEHAGQALREWGKHLQTENREREAMEVWKQLGARDVPQDRIEAAQRLAAGGDRKAAREVLMRGRNGNAPEPAIETALAELATMDGKVDEARTIHLALARAAQRPDELAPAISGWLRASSASEEPLAGLGDGTADRCLRAAWLAEAGKPLPAVRAGDELESTMRLALLRQHGKWKDVVILLEADAGKRGPLFLSELSEAKSAAGDLPGALAATRQWRERVPEQPAPWLREADILGKLGKTNDAVLLLRRATSRFEDDEEIARRLFGLLEDGIDPRESLEWAWKRHDRSQDETVRSTWLREILRVSRERNQLEDLQERFAERARRDPASPGPLMALSELAKARGESRQELDLLRRAAACAPENVSIITALATLEERQGETARAMERFTELARISPGHDSARALAQAKIRLGDIEGGMRDLQALVGEKGFDLHALEQSACDLATRGYIGEAIRMLAAVEPELRSARHWYVLGRLMETDGRETEAVDAFLKVLAEPDDPAESTASGYGRSYQSPNQLLHSMLYLRGSGRAGMPGVFTSLEVPESLAQAKSSLKPRLIALSLRHGEEIFTKVARAIPDLAVATSGQWRELFDFIPSEGQADWWAFVRENPGNHLGPQALVASGGISQATPEQVEGLLKNNPPLPVCLHLRASTPWRPDNPEFIASLDDSVWKNPALRQSAANLTRALFGQALSETSKPSVTADQCASALAQLVKAGPDVVTPLMIDLMKAQLALMQDRHGDFLNMANAIAAAGQNRHSQWYGHGGTLLELFAYLRRKAGDETADALIARLDSPVQRCQLAAATDPEKRLALVNRELAALPQDAPPEFKLGLIQMKWGILVQQPKVPPSLDEELRAAAADDSDPMLAFHACVMITGFRQPRDEAVRKRAQVLISRLSASPREQERQYAEVYRDYFGASSKAAVRTIPTPTRWGTAARYHVGNQRPQGPSLFALLNLEDKEQRLRETARFLEATARASGGRDENLRDECAALTKAGILDAILERIAPPADAGLSRQIAHLALLDAGSRPNEALRLIAAIAQARPWDTHWTVELALRSPDVMETRRLLDSVAHRTDFGATLINRLYPRGTNNSGRPVETLERVADWAAVREGKHEWMLRVLTSLSSGKIDPSRSQCLRRYARFCLRQPHHAEIAFRVMAATACWELPFSPDALARQVLLAGAYSEGQSASSVQRAAAMSSPVSALEHLVRAAAVKGDAAAFPPRFRDQLKTVDPAMDAWLTRLLAARKTTDLPDLDTELSSNSPWSAYARNQCAILRCGTLPDRDAWLTGVFREGKFQTNSACFREIIGHSLTDAMKRRKLPERIFALLEASAGPRKQWEKPTKLAVSPNGSTRWGNARLPEAARILLNVAAESEPELLLAAIEIYRVERVPLNQDGMVKQHLSSWLSSDAASTQRAVLAKHLNSSRAAPFQLGLWMAPGNLGDEREYYWLLPDIIRYGRDQSKVMEAAKDPEADILTLLQAVAASGDKAMRHRAILKSMPTLASLPADIREAALAWLTTGMDADDCADLPKLAATSLRKRLEAGRQKRLEMAKRQLEEILKNPTRSGSIDSAFGSLLGPVLCDDEAFVTEVLAAWRPGNGADKKAVEVDAFLNAVVSNIASKPRHVIAFLRLYDSLRIDPPPAKPAHSSRDTPIETLWGRMGPRIFSEQMIWRDLATLSPAVQAEFVIASARYEPNRDFGKDPKQVKTLREAAKNGTIARAALEWRLQVSAAQSDQNHSIDTSTLLDFTKALADAGAAKDRLAELLCDSYRFLPRMDDPAALMAATPQLLDGVKTLTDRQLDTVFQTLQGIMRDDLRLRETSGPAPLSHAAEITTLLRFTLARMPVSTNLNYRIESITPTIIATGDDGLLDLLLKSGGKSLTGNLPLIVSLLEKDRIGEAIALAPAPERRFSSYRHYDKHLESLAAKLRNSPDPQAFVLMARLAAANDASGENAPIESYAERRDRIRKDFERLRPNHTPRKHAELFVMLGLYDINRSGHEPALDEFIDDESARDFRKSLVEGDQRSSDSVNLFIPAVRSRMHADDLSGVARLTALLSGLPPNSSRPSAALLGQCMYVQQSLIHYANRHDAKLPPASVEIIRAYGKALAGQGASSLAHQCICLAATDAESLQAGLKEAGLERGIEPGPSMRGRSATYALPTMQALLRVALLHPVASEQLLRSLGPPPLSGHSSDVLLPLLHEPKIRERIPPEIFIAWTRFMRPVTQEDLEAMELYAKERNADFNDAQRAEIERMLKIKGARIMPRPPYR